MTNEELINKIREEILHLKMKELQRTNGVNTGAYVYLSSYAVLSILSNALTEESEDERIRKWLADYFGSIKATVWIHRDITCEQILDWLEKQKPAEWSEVELEFRGEKVAVKRPFFRDDKGRGYSTTKQDEEVAWNALRAWCEKKGISLYDLYPKAEWSEEDADILNCCISSIEEAKENRYAYKETDGDTSYDREIAFLKSLRPSWKPSEEQMKALQNAVALTACDKELARLYNQLKKL